MFDGFSEHRIKVSDTDIYLRMAGDGAPLLLVHGYPQNHVMWHKIAPQLSQHYTVIAPDLRGYGASGKPPTDENHAPYSKRAMARDLTEVMSALGHETFFLAGHDRGGRVAYRLTLDHPDRVKKLATLDIIPTWEQFDQIGGTQAAGIYHWYFLAQPAPFPERLIGNDSEYFLRFTLDSWAGIDGAFTEDAFAAYLKAFSNPDVIHASCEDYRAGITIDCEIDQTDVDAGNKITCPMLALWGGLGRPHKRKAVLETWQRWATNVTGQGLECGHFLPEEAPEETAAALIQFFKSDK